MAFIDALRSRSGSRRETASSHGMPPVLPRRMVKSPAAKKARYDAIGWPLCQCVVASRPVTLRLTCRPLEITSRSRPVVIRMS
jgi:hypothetical protein